MAKLRPPWSIYRDFDFGELNPLSESIFADRYDPNQNIFITIAEKLRKDLLPTSTKKSYIAIVLKVLSGPQVNNEASTNSGNLTKTISLKNFKSPHVEIKEKANKSQLLKVIARIPELDADIDLPHDEDDDARIAAHGEYHQVHENKLLEQVVPGSLINIELDNLENATGLDGRPAGRIISLYDPGSFAQLDTYESTIEGFNPPCKALRDLTAPGGGLYIGHTESDPVLFMGPPIRKYKGRIKTGMFGNGTPQTKQHFDRCLQKSSISAKYGIAGQAPWSESGAFVWVGHLRNNGYLDTFHRPTGLGRETIIYAPSMLDLSSPVEIKYYFHGANGFGRAWSAGPETTVESARAYAEPGDSNDYYNDFRDVVGPGIKDLIRQGRNFILVIPEMSYSWGFDGATRFMKQGLVTFDGSPAGGNFAFFHDEVMSVLERHFPDRLKSGANADEDIYMSILTDGHGSIALLTIATDPFVAGPRLNAWQEFLTLPIKRIDFVNAGGDAVGDVIDDLAIDLYKDYLTGRVDFEFNYITEHQTAAAANSFFEYLEHGVMFRKNNKSVGGLGEHKFSFIPSITEDPLQNPNIYISMHVAAHDTPNVKGKVGYAFSMINDHALGVTYKKSDSDDTISTSYDSVPDHAEACSKSQAAADAAKIQKKIEQLEKRIDFFEGFLNSYLQGQSVCSDKDHPEYKIYCDGAAVKTNNSSRFFTDYLNYLTNKRDLKELELISNFERQFLSNNLYKPNLIDFRDNHLKPALKDAEGVAEAWKKSKHWENLHKHFDRDAFSQPGFLTGDGEDALNQWVAIIAAPDAYKKMMLKVENTIDKLSSQTVQLSPDCAPPPMKLGDMILLDVPDATLNQPNIIKSPDADAACEGKQIVVPKNFDEIYEMIHYAPDQSRFKLTGRISKVPTKLDTISSFQIGTFNYRARASNGQITNAESPPVWSCLTERISSAWNSACDISGYTPFSITKGIRGYGQYGGNTAYKIGMSLHAFGLAIDVDPYIAGYSRDGAPVHSVYTGAWSSDLLIKHGIELYELGVFKTKPSVLIDNAYGDVYALELRMAENWDGAPSSYKGAGESGGQRPHYKKIMNMAKGAPIVPPGSSPTKWLVVFCETSGMRWGNAKFLKKRWRGGNSWNEAEKKRIAEIYNIPNIVNRIKAISWTTISSDDHMHFHFWSGRSLIPWSQIRKTKKRVG